MLFPRIFSQRIRFTAFATIAALFLLPAAARADQFQYVFSGNAVGSVSNGGSTGSGGVSFNLTLDEDTSAIANLGSGNFGYSNVTGTLVAGNGSTYSVSGLTLEVDPTTDFVAFLNSGSMDGLGLTNSALAGYNLASNLNISQTSSGITTVGGGIGLLTALDISQTGNPPVTIDITGANLLGFSATDLTPPSPTPEPSSLLLLGSGLSGVAMLRRRLVKA